MRTKQWNYTAAFGLLLFVLSLAWGCGGNAPPDISKVSINQGFHRFDRLLMERAKDSLALEQCLDSLALEHPEFVNLYGPELLGFVPQVPIMSQYLSFFRDSEIGGLYDSTRQVFGDFEKEKAAFHTAFRYYHYYLPEAHVPDIAMYLFGFNYVVVPLDSVLYIAPDQYLGPQSTYLAHLPAYIKARRSPEYLVCDGLKAWCTLEFAPEKEGELSLLEEMIWQGKVLAITKRCMPEVADSVLFGFTSAQVKFCIEHEYQIWGHLIEEQKLFATDSRTVQRYIGEAPFSSGMPAESPGRAATWIGWRIVESWMNTQDQSLAALIKESDAQKMLEQSQYKPKRR